MNPPAVRRNDRRQSGPQPHALGPAPRRRLEQRPARGAVLVNAFLELFEREEAIALSALAYPFEVASDRQGLNVHQDRSERSAAYIPMLNMIRGAHVGCNLVQAGNQPLKMNIGPSFASLPIVSLQPRVRAGPAALTRS